ncbi:DUF4307 domain-containing protein [Nocardioides sp. TF02-7]|uniref:DUF4307 domain-containing protein n=1 Tax=Nocardioides sp. TF02-7 TaxID=2917724 RepID=UPI001F0542E2|nr:DUF4307 domain-containing protein [Nocardioides sp. TF02-7]UMG91491.1 DUF4307 domain-containing protein [Nocardioides sp. TF02-7]
MASELVKHEIVDEHTVTVVLRVDLDDEASDPRCTVRALAPDKAVVGQQTFVPEETGQHDHTVEIATERRATAVEKVGCTAEGQPRPR